MILQVQGNPEQYAGNFSYPGRLSPWSYHNPSDPHRNHVKGELKEALLKGHPGLPDNKVTIKELPENTPLEANGTNEDDNPIE